MIHQFIFAYPRPGMTELEFQNYWVKVHAVRYASKIPQIRKYLVDTRVALPGEEDDPLWCGVAEIWLKNEQEQIESLQSREFLQGARLDEPNWAAFWRTLVLDTTTHTLLPETGGSAKGGAAVKLLVLSKRKEGLSLEDFRAYCLNTHAKKVMELPGLRGYCQSHVRDSFYLIGEATLDCIEQLWFDSVDAALAARNAPQQHIVNEDYRNFCTERYIHTMLVQQHWIIGPEARPYDAPGVLTASGAEDH